MNDNPTSLFERLPHLPAEVALETARRDLELRWADGNPIAVECYLSASPALGDDPEQALILVYAEILARLARGETAVVKDYVRRFPEFADRLGPIFEMHDVLAGFDANGPEQVVRPTTAIEPPDIPGYSELTIAGRGGMGLVYRGLDHARRPVAIKVVAADLISDPIRLVRFLQEGEILARLSHPGIVRFVAAGIHGRQPYLVTEWVGGGTLAQKTRQAWPAERAVRTMCKLAEATHYAHEQGIVHRDLKPANVVLVGEEPRIIDFGVARLLTCGGTMTGTGEVLGTPGYMAPEQLEGRNRDIGPATDVFALGAIFYELLAGRPPFVGSGILDVLRISCSDRAPPLPRLNSAISEKLDGICQRCLAKNPRDRFPSALGLWKELIRL